MAKNLGIDIRFEPLGEDLIESFHRCLDNVARERKYLAFIEAPPLDSTRNFVMNNISNNIPQFVAILDDNVVGFCDVRPINIEGFNHSGKLGMGVQKEYRRQGIGRKLTELAISKSSQQGLERIELEVYASNTPAICLYKSLGFLVEGVKRKARKLDGAYDDLIVMALIFE